MRKVALFDMDDTLADYTGKLLKDLKNIKNTQNSMVEYLF